METTGYVRVVNIRSQDPDFRANADEKVYVMDRSNRIMGNRHVMKTQSMAERDRVVEAHRKDLEADILRKGPMYQIMQEIAHEIVYKNTRVCLSCFCAPSSCHLDAVAKHIFFLTKEIRAVKDSDLTKPDLTPSPQVAKSSAFKS